MSLFGSSGIRGIVNDDMTPELALKAGKALGIRSSGFLSISDLDGYRIAYKNGWVLLRPSGTEPKIRITAEAEDEARLEELYSWAESVARGSIRLCRSHTGAGGDN
jgi:phosphomannomutase